MMPVRRHTGTVRVLEQELTMIKMGRDNPEGLTAREVIEDIAAFPLSQEMERDQFGEYKGGSSWRAGYAAFRNKSFAEAWLRLNPRQS